MGTSKPMTVWKFRLPVKPNAAAPSGRLRSTVRICSAGAVLNPAGRSSSVSATDDKLGVGVNVGVGVFVGVEVGMGVEVFVGLGVDVGFGVAVGVKLGVNVVVTVGA